MLKIEEWPYEAAKDNFKGVSNVIVEYVLVSDVELPVLYFNDRIQISGEKNNMYPIDSNLFYLFSGLDHNLKFKKDESLTSLPKIKVISNANNF